MPAQHAAGETDLQAGTAIIAASMKSPVVTWHRLNYSGWTVLYEQQCKYVEPRYNPVELQYRPNEPQYNPVELQCNNWRPKLQLEAKMFPSLHGCM
jgi:hypothetical protein